MCLKFLFTVNVQLGFLLIALIWKFDFSPFMILVIAILNDGKFAVQLHSEAYNTKQLHIIPVQSTLVFLKKYILYDLFSGTIMTIAKDIVKPSPHPDSWKLNEIFVTGIVYGAYMAVMTVVFFWAMRSTDFFSVSIDIFFCLLHYQSIQIEHERQ